MGSKLPVISGRDEVRALERMGWSVARQSASHIVMTKPGEMASLSVPDHKEVARGHFAASFVRPT